jgi:hypothetical protein
MNGQSFEYTGYVESINIKGVGNNSHQFLFSLVSVHGDQHWPFLLDHRSEPLRYTAMVSLLTAAYAGNKIVKMNTTPNPGGSPYAAEIEVFRS